MKVSFDTNVLVAALLDEHLHHRRAFPAVERVAAGEDEGFVSAHTLAEVYAILTKLPQRMRHSPTEALLAIEENIVKNFTVCHLDGKEYLSIVRESAANGVQGGTIYDALALQGARKAKAERFFTFNLQHFRSLTADSRFPVVCAP